MRQEAADAERETAMLGPQEFVNESFVYVYDFDLVKIQPLLLAKSVFEFANNQLRTPSRSLHEFEANGQMEYLAVGMSYLLLKKNTDGTVVPFDRKEARSSTLTFIRNLPSKDYAKLVRCKENFFLKAGIVDYALLMQSMPLLETFAGQIQSANGSEQSTTPSETSQDSTPPESLTES